MTTEPPVEHRACGPCLTGHHRTCIPTITSDKKWRCGCHERGHRRKDHP